VILLSLFPDYQDAATSERIDSVREGTIRHIHGLLPSPEGEEFKNRLAKLAGSACEA